MHLAWKFDAGVPISVQIRDRLRKDILSGVYGRGEPFPTTRQLAAEAGVNPNTMQKALSLLEEEGLLETYRTVGRAVTSDEEAIAAARNRAAEALVGQMINEAILLGLTEGELTEKIRRKWNDGKQHSDT